MTRPAAIALARQRVQETGKPWVVLSRHTIPPKSCNGAPCSRRHDYAAASSYDEMGSGWHLAAWASLDGGVRVYDGLEATASEETR